MLQMPAHSNRAWEDALAEPVEIPRVEQILHEVDGRDDRVGERERSDVSLDGVLAGEHGDAGVRARSAAREVDEMTNAARLRCVRGGDPVTGLAVRADPVGCARDE